MVSVSTPGVLPTTIPRCARGIHVDVVVADRHLADHFEIGSGGVHQCAVDAVGEHTEQAIDAAHALAQGFVGRRQLILPDVDDRI